MSRNREPQAAVEGGYDQHIALGPLPHARVRLHPALSIVGWLLALAFLAWAVRLVALEGYLYEIPGNFLGDFTRTAELVAPTWFRSEENTYELQQPTDD